MSSFLPLICRTKTLPTIHRTLSSVKYLSNCISWCQTSISQPGGPGALGFGLNVLKTSFPSKYKLKIKSVSSTESIVSLSTGCNNSHCFEICCFHRSKSLILLRKMSTESETSETTNSTVVSSSFSITSQSTESTNVGAKNIEGVGEEKPSNKRSAQESESEIPAKQSKTGAEGGGGEEAKVRRKKVALLMVYSGKGYFGMQKSPGVQTIEQALQEALVKTGAITQDLMDNPMKMHFQRAARTDKGVSAAGQIVSLKMNVDVENFLEKMNAILDPQIRILGVKRATRGFDGKNWCSHRTYAYILPTFAFAPSTEHVTEAYRVTPEILQRVNELLAMYKGTRNFFNYTSGRKHSDPSSKRYIIDMKVGEPWLQGDMEFARITVTGQSFMLHQIRKMIGLTLAVVKGFATVENIQKTWGAERVDVPKAPGLGLMLDQLHYRGYNKRYGSDGVHEPITWDAQQEEIDKFKREFIYKDMFETEANERSMLKWLATLPAHHFDVKATDLPITAETGIGRAMRRVDVERLREKDRSLNPDSSTPSKHEEDESEEKVSQSALVEETSNVGTTADIKSEPAVIAEASKKCADSEQTVAEGSDR